MKAYGPLGLAGRLVNETILEQPKPRINDYFFRLAGFDRRALLKALSSFCMALTDSAATGLM